MAMPFVAKAHLAYERRFPRPRMDKFRCELRKENLFLVPYDIQDDAKKFSTSFKARQFAVRASPHSTLAEKNATAKTTLESKLSKLAQKLGLNAEPKSTEPFNITGEEMFFGLPGKWQLAFDNRGRFWELYEGEHFAYEAAFDGERVWQTDTYGNCYESDFDERETTLLVAWLRVGFWLRPASKQHFTFRAAKNELDILGVKIEPNEEVLGIARLINGKVDAIVTLNTDSGFPHRLFVTTYGEYEEWELTKWQQLLDSQQFFPAQTQRKSKSGDLTWSILESVKRISDEKMGNLTTLPTTRVERNLSREVIFDDSVSPHLEVETASNGQIVVRALLQGKFYGYFVLDSGASGFTLSKTLAERLNLTKFGTTSIIGLQGVVVSAFRKASSFQIGPMTFKNPIFLEVETNGVLASAGLEVIGICGYDVFANSIVEMRNNLGLRISLHNPETYHLKVSSSINWQPISLLCNTPHITATVKLRRLSKEKYNSKYNLTLTPKYVTADLNFMVDSGAGGAELLLLGESGQDPFFSKVPVRGHGLASGVGNADKEGEISPVEVRVVKIDKVEIGNTSFKEVDGVILPYSEESGLRMSKWVSGLICVDLLKRCSLVVFDYQRKRILLVQGSKVGNLFEFPRLSEE